MLWWSDTVYYSFIAFQNDLPKWSTWLKQVKLKSNRIGFYNLKVYVNENKFIPYYYFAFTAYESRIVYFKIAADVYNIL